MLLESVARKPLTSNDVMSNHPLSNRGLISRVVTLPPLAPFTPATKKSETTARPKALLKALVAAPEKRAASADGNS